MRNKMRIRKHVSLRGRKEKTKVRKIKVRKRRQMMRKMEGMGEKMLKVEMIKRIGVKRRRKS